MKENRPEYTANRCLIEYKDACFIVIRELLNEAVGEFDNTVIIKDIRVIPIGTDFPIIEKTD